MVELFGDSSWVCRELTVDDVCLFIDLFGWLLLRLYPMPSQFAERINHKAKQKRRQAVPLEDSSLYF